MTIAPEFPSDLPWLHVDTPPRLAEALAGHVVLLHFWTAESVHCQLLLQTLSRLDLRFRGRPFAIVGCHAARAEHEKGILAVGRAARVLGIDHAIVVDDDRRMWADYRAEAWPTLVLIDTQGKVRFRGAGEAIESRLTRAVESLLHEADLSRLRKPFRPAPGWSVATATGLAHPTGLAHDPARGWLWIADTANHRVLAVDASSGEQRLAVGIGRPGAGDETFEGASFYLPTNVLVHEDLVLVADTGNHCIRRIDLDHGVVETFVGNGRPELDVHGGGSGQEQPLRAPTAMAVLDGILFVAVTGNHQIWSVSLDDRQAWPVAGGGVPGASDGALDEALLDEPVALAAHGDDLLVGERTGAVRVVETGNREVRTLLRAGPGDDDDGPRATCAAALGLTSAGRLLVLDAGKGRLLDVDPAGGGGEARPLDGAVHPRGLTLAPGDSCWVTDTGNDRLLRAGPDARPGPTVLSGIGATGTERPRSCAPVRVPPGADIGVRLPLPLPPGAYVDPESPVFVHLSSGNGAVLAFDHDIEPELQADEAVVHGIPTAQGAANDAAPELPVGTLEVSVFLGSCHSPGGVVHPQRTRFEVPVVFDPGAGTEIVLQPLD